MFYTEMRLLESLLQMKYTQNEFTHWVWNFWQNSYWSPASMHVSKLRTKETERNWNVAQLYRNAIGWSAHNALPIPTFIVIYRSAFHRAFSQEILFLFFQPVVHVTNFKILNACHRKFVLFNFPLHERDIPTLSFSIFLFVILLEKYHMIHDTYLTTANMYLYIEKWQRPRENVRATVKHFSIEHYY